jgi:hypothetical protein
VTFGDPSKPSRNIGTAGLSQRFRFRFSKHLPKSVTSC